MLGDAPKSPSTRGVSDVLARVERIKKYAEQYDYRSDPVEDELTEAERELLARVRNEMKSLRREVEALIDAFKERTGFR